MQRAFKQMLRELREHWKNYVFQSLIATLVIFAVLLILSMEQAVIIASIGATTFIVFATPNSPTAKPWNVIGGHVVGLLCGAACGFIPHSSLLAMAAVYALAVGLSIFVMVVIDTEHPPAAGTALGIAMAGVSLEAAAAIITSAVVLSLAHHVCRRHLKDLT